MLELLEQSEAADLVWQIGRLFDGDGLARGVHDFLGLGLGFSRDAILVALAVLVDADVHDLVVREVVAVEVHIVGAVHGFAHPQDLVSAIRGVALDFHLVLRVA